MYMSVLRFDMIVFLCVLQGSDIESLGLDQALEFGNGPASFPPVREPDLLVPTGKENQDVTLYLDQCYSSQSSAALHNRLEII